MVNWTALIVIILGTPIVIGYLIYKIKTAKSIGSLDVTANQPFIENDYRKEFTDGYARGTLKSAKLRKNGCYLVEFYPSDVEQGEDIPRPPLQSFVVKEELYKPLLKISTRRIIIKTITRDPSKIPVEMKDTTEGKWATKEGQLGYLKSTFGTAISSGDEAIADAMKDYNRGGIARATLAKLREDARARKEILDSQQEVEKPK